MRSAQRHLLAVRTGMAVALLLAGTLATGVANARSRPSPIAVHDADVLVATIFSFDGKDFVRTKTTLVTESGASAVGTKLDRGSTAFKSLMQKHYVSGAVTVYGKSYDGTYAPLIDEGGKVTGALFVGTPK